MTRINAGIQARELPDRLLIAEHREITRIANVKHRNSYDGPFKLGKGHVLFFAQRMGYVKRRYFELLVECRRRGFKVTDKSSAFEGKDGPDWDDAEARPLVLERIHSRNFSLLSERKTAMIAPYDLKQDPTTKTRWTNLDKANLNNKYIKHRDCDETNR